jgi:O-6-methylguanine DNA methyltransferase
MMKGTDFEKKVWRAVCQIPRGRVATYREVAIWIGHPRSWRAVARVLARNPRPITVPCHRVVRSDGRLGGYVLGLKEKIKLLVAEGVEVKKGRVDLEKFGFRFRAGGRFGRAP